MSAKSIRFIALFICQALAATGARAGSVGRIDTIFSPLRVFTVSVRRGAIDLQLKTGQAFETGDILRTARGQGVSIEFSDDSVVVFGEKSEAVVNSKIDADSSNAGFELKSGSAFVHVAKLHRTSNPFMVANRNGLLGADTGDFELRVAGDVTTVYAITSNVTVATTLAQLTNSKKPFVVYQGNFARLGAGGSAPDTFVRSRLFAFEGEDAVFGQHVKHLRQSRYPLPVASAGENGNESGRNSFASPGAIGGAPVAPSVPVGGRGGGGSFRGW